MATKLTARIPKDFPNTLPDIIVVNKQRIQTDLLQDILVADLNFSTEKAKEVIVLLLGPEWSEE